MKKDNKKRNFLVIILSIVIVVGLAGFGNILSNLASPSLSSDDKNNLVKETIGQDQLAKERPRVPCINPLLPAPAEYHIHPRLKIIIDGEERVIPANIGLSFSSCERVIHTHDTTGEIHIEPNFYQEFTLGDFFLVWGKPFSKEQILDFRVDDEHEILMTVNGKPNFEYENLILKDKQEIVIEYRKKK